MVRTLKADLHYRLKGRNHILTESKFKVTTSETACKNLPPCLHKPKQSLETQLFLMQRVWLLKITVPRENVARRARGNTASFGCM